MQQALLSLMDEEPTLLTSVEREQLAIQVLDEVFGLGPIESLLDDATISDILVNGAHKKFMSNGQVCWNLPACSSGTTST